MEEKLKKLVKKLTLENKTVSTMESCTGGGLVNALTNIEGASEIIKFSAVTYANEYKIKMGVSKEIIDKYTVYSKQVAEAMAKAIAEFANSNYGVGITGKLNRVDHYNLNGNDNEVFISIYDNDNKSFDTFNFVVNKCIRKDNKEAIVMEVLTHLVDC